MTATVNFIERERGNAVTESAYPYATHLDIKFDPLELIDVSMLAKAVTDQWYNQTLCRVNESVVPSVRIPPAQT
jgi:hypothetical protein